MLSNLSKTKIIIINKIIDKSNVMSKIENKTFKNLKRLIIKIKTLCTKRSIKNVNKKSNDLIIQNVVTKYVNTNSS